jgi:hypothetical protein
MLFQLLPAAAAAAAATILSSYNTSLYRAATAE